MKKWNNPELMVLGVENTFTDGDFDFFASWGGHTCHRESKFHNGNCSTGDGHTPIKTGDCEEHINTIVYTDEDGTNYSCCCHGFS